MIRSMMVATTAVAMTLAFSGVGNAQGFPNRTVRIVVTSGPGSAPDLSARVVGQVMSQRIKQPVIVENRVGANGAIAVDVVIQAPADGYTLLAAHAAAVSTNPFLIPQTAQKALTDLVPVSKLADTDFTFAVRSNMGINTVQEFVQYAKANPGKVNFATSSIGSLPNLSAELLKLAAGLDYVIIPHPGGSASVSSTAAAQTDAVIEAPSVMLPFQDNQLKILARTGAQRTERFPGLPTFKELGIDMVSSGWIGVLARKGTPDDVLDYLQKNIADAARDPVVVERLRGMSFEAIGNSRQQFAEEWKKETETWKKVIETAKIKVE